MKQKVNFSQFCDSFWNTYKDNFSYEGKRALFDYLESVEDDMGSEIELDTVALCCEYTEYESAMEAAQDHGYEEIVDLEPHGSVDLEEVAALEEKQALEWLEKKTQVIRFEGGLIIQQF